jgi:GPCR-Autoproteolysis INducing (GAIN) domain
LIENILQLVMEAGSSLLSDERMDLWAYLNESAQAEAASALTSAVESSAFLLASVDNKTRSAVISNQTNIG